MILTTLFYRYRCGTKTSFIHLFIQQSSPSAYWHEDVGDASVKRTSVLFSWHLFSSERYKKIYVLYMYMCVYIYIISVSCNQYEIIKSNTNGWRWGVRDQMHLNSDFSDKSASYSVKSDSL